MADNERPLGFFQILTSVLASFFGVQNDRTRERDFTRGRARDFIFIGILLTVGFILSVWGLVMLVMTFAVS